MSARVFVLQEDTLEEEGAHRGFTSQNSHLVFVFHLSVAKRQSLHHIPVWLSTPLIKHRLVIPPLHRPSLPFPLTDCRGRPHTNSSLKCPPEGPALYSWKVRSALQEKALQNEHWITGKRENNKIRSQTQLSLSSFFPFSPQAPVHSSQLGYQETMGRISLFLGLHLFILLWYFLWLFPSVPKTLNRLKRTKKSQFVLNCQSGR